MKKLIAILLFLLGLAVTPALAIPNGGSYGISTPSDLRVSYNVSGFPAQFVTSFISHATPNVETLKIYRVNINSASVLRGATVTASYLLENTGDSAITGVVPTLRFYAPTFTSPNIRQFDYAVTAVPSSIANFAAGAKVTVNFTIVVSGFAMAGTANIDGYVTGTSSGAVIDNIWYDTTAASYYSAAVTSAVWVVTGNPVSSVNVGQIRISQNPFNIGSAIQVYVPITNLTASNVVQGTPNATDIYIRRNLGSAANLNPVSFNITAPGVISIPAGQTRVVTYNLTALASAVSGSYTIGVVTGNPSFAILGTGTFTAPINSGIVTRTAFLDTVSPNLVFVTTNIAKRYVSPTNNFSLTFRFNDRMRSSVTPTIAQTASGLAPTLLGGTWSTTTTTNDTFRLNAFSAVTVNQGIVTYSVSLARDLAGNYSIPSLNAIVIYYDATAPNGTITINGGSAIVTHNTNITTAFNVTDNFSAAANLQVRVSGVDASAATSIPLNTFVNMPPSIQLAVNQPSGTKNITFTFRDQAGNTRSVVKSFYFDFIGLTFITPTVNQATSANFSVSVNTSITATQIRYYYQVGAGALNLITTDPTVSNGYIWNTAAVPQSPQIRLYGVVSIPGTPNITANVGFLYVDRGVPTANLTTPFTNLVTGTNSQSGTATDNISGVTRIEYYIDGPTSNVIPLSSATGTANWIFNWNVPSGHAMGTVYTLYYRAVDRAGNRSAYKNFTLIKSGATPNVVINYPTNNAYVMSGLVTINGTVTSAFPISQVQISLGGAFVPVTVGTANFQHVVNFVPFAHGQVLNVRARALTATTPNLIGTSNIVVLRVDKVAPIIAFSNLVSGNGVAGTLNIRGTCLDVNAGCKTVFISVNGGASYVTANGTTNWNYVWAPPGPAGTNYNIRVYAVDNAQTLGNRSTTLSIGLNKNFQALPFIALSTPSRNAYVNNTVAVTGTANALLGETIVYVQISTNGGASWVTVNGTTLWNNNFIVPSIDPHGTTYNVLLRAETTRGVLGLATPSVTIRWFKDAYAPAITLANPVNGMFLTGIQTIKAFAVSSGASANAVAAIIDGVNMGALTRITTSGNVTTWTVNFDFSTLSGANHTLVAQVTDKAGNIGTSTTVNFKTQSTARFTVPIPSGSNMSFTSLSTSPVYATNQQTVFFNNLPVGYTFQVYVDGVFYPTTIVAGPRLQVILPAVQQDHVINILSTNTATGITSANYQVVNYDVTPPTINSRLNGTFILMNGDTIAPNQLFQLNVTDNVNGSGFGQVPSFNLFTTVPSGSINARMTNGVGTVFPLGNHAYNTSSQIYTFQIVPNAAVGTYNLAVIAKDNAGNRSITFNVTALQVQTGANGTSGAIDTSRPVLNYPNPWDPNSSSQVAFSYYLTDGAREANIYIYNQVNELIHVIQINSPGTLGTQANYNRLLWDGRDRFGQVLANGVYLYAIVVKSDAGVSVAKGKMAVLRR